MRCKAVAGRAEPSDDGLSRANGALQAVDLTRNEPMLDGVLVRSGPIRNVSKVRQAAPDLVIMTFHENARGVEVWTPLRRRRWTGPGDQPGLRCRRCEARADRPAHRSLAKRLGGSNPGHPRPDPEKVEAILFPRVQSHVNAGEIATRSKDRGAALRAL